MEKIEKIINSKAYTKVLEIVAKTKKLNILSDYYSTLLKIAEKNLNKSKLSIDDLNEVLTLDQCFVYYVLKKIEIIDGRVIEEEYPDGQEPDEDEKTVTTAVLGKSVTFIFDNMIEYYFIKNNPIELERYLKDIGIPNSKKYAKEICEVYNLSDNDCTNN